jgi:hypothetical protein
MEMPTIVLIVVLQAVAFAITCSIIGAKRTVGKLAGAALGLFFSFIGLIVVLNFPVKVPLNTDEKLKKYKAQFDKGKITEAQYNYMKAELIEEQEEEE